ncbi:MAG: autotransporter-associated beta strand repeat-containing protein [Candidatus Accumulibacter sp.]|nr:autotransporter-associated beta strand repeat-containing protein [Accumulibacter sp.]
MGALSGAGNVINTHGLTAQSGTFSGVISGAGSLTKTSAGTLTLSGVNTYTGATAVSAGTLMGNIADNTDLTVENGAT